MNIEETIKSRHSVREYLSKDIEPNKIRALKELIEECNKDGNLHIQLILNDKDVFDKYILHYGRIKNCNNYLAIIGKESENLQENAGYYGEKIVLKAQELGLNTCWVAGTYSQGYVTAKIEDDEELVCVIALGYGRTQGRPRKSKTFDQVSFSKEVPDWYKLGIEYALLAPTAINQQKFRFELVGDNKVLLTPLKGHLTKLDAGIVKYHFELGAGKENFEWTL